MVLQRGGRNGRKYKLGGGGNDVEVGRKKRSNTAKETTISVNNFILFFMLGHFTPPFAMLKVVYFFLFSSKHATFSNIIEGGYLISSVPTTHVRNCRKDRGETTEKTRG